MKQPLRRPGCPFGLGIDSLTALFSLRFFARSFPVAHIHQPFELHAGAHASWRPTRLEGWQVIDQVCRVWTSSLISP